MVHNPLVADGVFYKPLVACVDRHVHAFGGIRGSSFTSICMVCADRRLEAFGGIRGLLFATLWWLTWIAVHKPLVADGVLYKPLVAYVDYRV